jgi:hypothetical protein
MNGMMCGGGRLAGEDGKGVLGVIGVMGVIGRSSGEAKGLDFNAMSSIGDSGSLAPKPFFNSHPVNKSPPPTGRREFPLMGRSEAYCWNREVLAFRRFEANNLAKNLLCVKSIHSRRRTAKASMRFRGVWPGEEGHISE